MAKIYQNKIFKNPVNRVLGQINHGQRVRGLITRQSEFNLHKLNTWDATPTRAFLKNLLRLDHLAVPIKKIVVPDALAEAHNREILLYLNSTSFLMTLINENGVLDLRKAGLKQTPRCIDLTPKTAYKPHTLEEYQEVLDRSFKSFAADEELGYIFLFRSAVRIWIDLYAAGEKRSALIRNNEKPGMTQDLQRIKDFVDYLTETFPFGKSSQQKMIFDGYKVVSDLLFHKNHPAGNAKMISMMENIEKNLSDRMLKKMEQSNRSRGWKLKYDGKGVWMVATSGYLKTETGLTRKKQRIQYVYTPKLLRMIQHVVDSVSKEIDVNRTFISEIESLKTQLPDGWDKIYEIFLKFSGFDVFKKGKACAELEGVLQILPISSSQATRLAFDLLEMVQKDLAYRQKDLAAQKERFLLLGKEAEEHIGHELNDFSMQIAKKLSEPEILFDIKKLNKIGERLGGFMGSFLKGEIREPWLRRAKSRVLQLKYSLKNVEILLEQKKHLMQEIVNMRNTYRKEREKIRKAAKSDEQIAEGLKKLKKQIQNSAKEKLSDIAALNNKMVGSLQHGAKTILSTGLLFKNRNEETITEDDYYKQLSPVFSAFDKLNQDQVEALDSEKNVLGRVLRTEAKQMKLNYRELGH